jgi:putative PIN family toxin of toxin-antitoxin system
MRILVDTNWLISYLIKREASNLKLLWLDTTITFISSEKQIKEFLAKIYFPKFRKYFEIEEALEFLKSFLKRAELTDIKTTVTICRDPKDNFLLSSVQRCRSGLFNYRGQRSPGNKEF